MIFPGQKIIFSEKNLGKTKFEKKIVEKKFNFKQLYLAHIPSKFQVVQTTASLCHNVVSHKKSQKNDFSLKKRGPATTVQPRTRFF